MPNLFIDNYMKDANDAQLKIYLFLLRKMNACQATSVSDIADMFNHTEKDVIRALKYWEQKQLIDLDFDGSGRELVGIHIRDLDAASGQRAGSGQAAPSFVPSPAAEPEPEAEDASPYAKPSYSASQLREFKSRQDTVQLLGIAEAYIGKPLTPSEIKSVLYFSDRLHFSDDLIDYLIESCVTKNHKSVHYMEKIALSWAKAGITTVTAAKEESSAHNGLAAAVRRAFGIQGRDFVPYEKSFLDKWQKEFGFDGEIAACACERTIRSIHQVSFEYADSILKNWHSHGVRTMQDVQALDALHQERTREIPPARTGNGPRKNRFNDFPQRSYDTGQLEKELLNYGIN